MIHPFIWRYASHTNNTNKASIFVVVPEVQLLALLLALLADLLAFGVWLSFRLVWFRRRGVF
jgi:hypothetical protein